MSYLTIVLNVLAAVVPTIVLIWKIIQHRREKKKPVVYYGLKINPLFYEQEALKKSPIKFLLSGPDQKIQAFDYVYLLQFVILNATTKGWESMDFGITLPSNFNCVYINSETMDRHHNCSFNPLPTLLHPNSEIEVTCTPFYKEDHYSFVAIIQSDKKTLSQEDFKISTSKEVTFTNEINRKPPLAARFLEFIIKFFF